MSCIVERPADFDALTGQEVAVTDYLEITQRSVDEFAEITGDRQWIHIDPDRAKLHGPFGGTIAHGFLILALLPKLFSGAIGARRTRMIVNSGANYIRFPAAVPVGSKIRARIRLNACKTVAATTEATWLVTIESSGGRLPCCILEWVLRYYGEDAA